ncbi:family 43 glycosylhydrolase [Paenibacillus sp. sgz500958]|uniref:family 43 glycosylhydrolase n=1 Tax=Paenibacillus sp. sgz500958 TaxID=3242475 RepID=UPI0036D2A1CA
MNIRGKKIIWPLAGVLLILIAGGVYLLLQQMKSEEVPAYNGHGGTFKNTLAEIDTPDPSVIYKAGYYYMTFTHNGTDIMVMKSRTLDFRQAERAVVWYPPVESPYSAEIWAPEIQFIQGKWYIYFAADNGQNENHRMYALEGDSEDPMGSYTFKGQIKDETDKWAIDGLVMEHEQKLYFVWSGWEGDVNEAQNTYIAPMSDPLTISGPRVLLSEPDLDWEKAGGPPYINEGHSILHKDDRVFIIYSGAGSWTPYYSLGMLALKPGSDPLDPAGWEKAQQPLLNMDEEAGVFGPGHNSFASSPDGSEQWIVYHATSGAADGWNNRKARAAKVTWDDGGLPVFGKPQALSTPVEVPSGMGIFWAGDAASEGERLTFPNLPSTVDTIIPLLVHYKNTNDSKGSVEMLINGTGGYTIELPAIDGDETGYAYTAIPFTSGMNELSFNTAGANIEILAIEIPRYEAETALLEGGSEAEENPFASNGSIASLYDEGSSVRFINVQVPQSGVYTLSIAAINPSQDGAELGISVNSGKEKAAVIKPQERNEVELIHMELELKAGRNEISVFDRKGSFGIDYMDVWHKPNEHR